MVHLLSDELVARGLDITLFASRDSKTSLWDRAICLDGFGQRPQRTSGDVGESATTCLGIRFLQFAAPAKRGYTAIALHRRRRNREAEQA
jgi:hypothetical protein